MAFHTLNQGYWDFRWLISCSGHAEIEILYVTANPVPSVRGVFEGLLTESVDNYVDKLRQMAWRAGIVKKSNDSQNFEKI